MAEGTVQSIEISAPAGVIYGIAADLAAYPDWAQGVRSVEILEEDADGMPVRAAFVVDGMTKRIGYELVYTHDAPNRMSWTAIPGDDISEMEGSYDLTPLDDETTSVYYMLRVSTSFTIPGFLRRQAEKQIVMAALRGLKKQAEAAAKSA
ncbi:MAG: SRPBCC family protein [Acidimicrobiia bacterium]|nr:SRPBCC family protein [Acidimicrobiia bacterium]